MVISKPNKPDDKVRKVAIGLLSRREYPRKKLEERLIGRGYCPSSVSNLINQLEESGLFSESRYVDSFINFLVDGS